VGGNVLTLIPLFAIGVFTGFTLSQTGLVVHWSRARPPRWRYRAAINGLGAAATAVATVVFIMTKFTEGAWVVVIAVPAFMYLFTRIHRYYRRAGRALGLGEIPGKPQVKPTVVVVPVAAVSRLAQYAIGQAHSLSEHVIAVTVALEDPAGSSARAREIERQWARWDHRRPARPPRRRLRPDPHSAPRDRRRRSRQRPVTPEPLANFPHYGTGVPLAVAGAPIAALAD
jgi:hypothetical protein